jgi:hypothetical protein
MYCHGLVLSRVAKKDIGVRTTMGSAPFYFAHGAKVADVSATTGNPFYFATTSSVTTNQPTLGQEQGQGQGMKTKAGGCLLI